MSSKESIWRRDLNQGFMPLRVSQTLNYRIFRAKSSSPHAILLDLLDKIPKLLLSLSKNKSLQLRGHSFVKEDISGPVFTSVDVNIFMMWNSRN